MTASLYLATAADLRGAFFDLIGADAQSEYLSEDEPETQIRVMRLLQQGLWNAQSWMLSFTRFRGWRKVATLSVGAADATGVRSAPLPEDFLRLDGDYFRTALQYPDGTLWGSLVDVRDAGSRGSYWVEDDDEGEPTIYFGSGVALPTTLQVKYHFRHADLSEDGSIVFPKQDRGLIPAEASILAMNQGWFPQLDRDIRERLLTNLEINRSNAANRARRDKEPTHFRNHGSPYGTRHFMHR